MEIETEKKGEPKKQEKERERDSIPTISRICPWIDMSLKELSAAEWSADPYGILCRSVS